MKRATAVSRIMTPRRAYLILLVLLVPIGFATKFYNGPVADWVSDSLGGLLYVMFWMLLAMAIRPHARIALVALAVLTVTCLLEFLQFWHPIWLAPIRATFLGHALLGNTFSWLDFPYYLLGALLGYGCARWVDSHFGIGNASTQP